MWVLIAAMAVSACPQGQHQYEVRYNKIGLMFSPSLICASNPSEANTKARAMNPGIPLKEVKRVS